VSTNSISLLGPSQGRRLALIGALVLAGSFCVFYLALEWEIEPLYTVTVALLVPLGFFAMRKWPLIILAGLLFVGELKTVPAQGISLKDPTMILLLLSTGALLLDRLLVLGRISPGTIRALFAGQVALSTLFLLFCAVIALSLLYTPSALGGIKSARFATFEVVVFFAPMLLLKRKADVRQLLVAIVILGVVLAVRVVIGLEHPSEQVLKGNEDITKIGESELLGFALLICLYGKFCKSRALKYACIVFFFFAVVACAARTALVALLVSLLASACAARGGSGLLSRKAVIIGLVLAFTVTIPTYLWLRDLPAAQGKVSWKVGELEALASGSPIGTVGYRLGFYRSALNALVEHPIIGLGVGGWSIYYYDEDVLHYPHDFVLEVGAEQGAVGLIILILLLAMLFRSALRLLQSDPYLGFVFPLLIFTLSYHLTTGTVESRELWFICGLVAAASRLSTHARLGDHAQMKSLSINWQRRGRKADYREALTKLGDR
jgi:O-antigen ligase